MSRVLLTIHKDNDEWIPISFIPAQHRSEYSVYWYRVMISPSSRATCRKCNSKILKDELRIGNPIKWHGAMYGYISSWTHVKCTRLSDDIDTIPLPPNYDKSITNPIDLFDPYTSIYEFSKLTKEQQSYVISEFMSYKTPEHLEHFNHMPELVPEVYSPLVTPPYAFQGELLGHQLDGVGWLLHNEGVGMCYDVWNNIVEQDKVRFRHMLDDDTTSSSSTSSHNDNNNTNDTSISHDLQQLVYSLPNKTSTQSLLSHLLPTTSQGMYNITVNSEQSIQQQSSRVPLPCYDYSTSISSPIPRYPSHGMILADEMGMGKAQPLDSLVLTPTGYIRMGDIRVGQDVISPDGTTTTVEAIFPQGVRPVYEIELVDGRIVKADEDHLWTVSTTPCVDQKCSTQVLTTKSLKDSLTLPNGDPMWHIETITPVHLGVWDSTLDPYTLGSTLCVVPSFAPEGKLNALFPPQDNTNRELKRLGIMGLDAHTKCVPSQLLNSDINSRLGLLQGLLDLNGSPCDAGFEFYSTSKPLAENVLWLTRSLGGSIDIYERFMDGNPFYKTQGRLPDHFMPFRSSQKIKEFNKVTKRPLTHLAIKRIEYIGDQETQCIRVSSDLHEYVTDHFTRTHNTVQIISLILEQQYRWYRICDSIHASQYDNTTELPIKIGGPLASILPSQLDPTQGPDRLHPSLFKTIGWEYYGKYYKQYHKYCIDNNIRYDISTLTGHNIVDTALAERTTRQRKTPAKDDIVENTSDDNDDEVPTVISEKPKRGKGTTTRDGGGGGRGGRGKGKVATTDRDEAKTTTPAKKGRKSKDSSKTKDATTTTTSTTTSAESADKSQLPRFNVDDTSNQGFPPIVDSYSRLVYAPPRWPLYPHAGAGPTLVIAPTNTLIQWEKEFKHFATCDTSLGQPALGIMATTKKSATSPHKQSTDITTPDSSVSKRGGRGSRGGRGGSSTTRKQSQTRKRSPQIVDIDDDDTPKIKLPSKYSNNDSDNDDTVAGGEYDDDDDDDDDIVLVKSSLDGPLKRPKKSSEPDISNTTTTPKRQRKKIIVDTPSHSSGDDNDNDNDQDGVTLPPQTPPPQQQQQQSTPSTNAPETLPLFPFTLSSDMFQSMIQSVADSYDEHNSNNNNNNTSDMVDQNLLPSSSSLTLSSEPDQPGVYISDSTNFHETSLLVPVKTRPHPLRVLIYYGLDRALAGPALGQYDVVITSYNIVANDWKSYNEYIGAVIDGLDDDDDPDGTSPTKQKRGKQPAKGKKTPTKQQAKSNSKRGNKKIKASSNDEIDSNDTDTDTDTDTDNKPRSKINKSKQRSYKKFQKYDMSSDLSLSSSDLDTASDEWSSGTSTTSSSSSSSGDDSDNTTHKKKNKKATKTSKRKSPHSSHSSSSSSNISSSKPKSKNDSVLRSRFIIDDTDDDDNTDDDDTVIIDTRVNPLKKVPAQPKEKPIPKSKAIKEPKPIKETKAAPAASRGRKKAPSLQVSGLQKAMLTLGVFGDDGLMDQGVNNAMVPPPSATMQPPASVVTNTTNDVSTAISNHNTQSNQRITHGPTVSSHFAHTSDQRAIDAGDDDLTIVAVSQPSSLSRHSSTASASSSSLAPIRTSSVLNQGAIRLDISASDDTVSSDNDDGAAPRPRTRAARTSSIAPRRSSRHRGPLPPPAHPPRVIKRATYIDSEDEEDDNFDDISDTDNDKDESDNDHPNTSSIANDNDYYDDKDDKLLSAPRQQQQPQQPQQPPQTALSTILQTTLGAAGQAAQAMATSSIMLTTSPLHAIHWSRLVLDEGHRLKNRNTLQYKAVTAINSDSRICLTGTPIHNNTSDVHSLFSVIKKVPTATYVCKTNGCICQSCHWLINREKRKCIRCNHASSRHSSWFSANVTAPLTRYGMNGQGKVAFYLLNKAMHECIKRRTKDSVQTSLQLPPINVTRYVVHPSESEYTSYQNLFSTAANTVDNYAYEGSFLRNYAHIFALLSALRICCNHPTLVKSRVEHDEKSIDIQTDNTTTTTTPNGSHVSAEIGVEDGDPIFITDDHVEENTSHDNNVSPLSPTKTTNRDAKGGVLSSVISGLEQATLGANTQDNNNYNDDGDNNIIQSQANIDTGRGTCIVRHVTTSETIKHTSYSTLLKQDPISNFNLFGDINTVNQSHTVIDYYPPDPKQSRRISDGMYAILEAALRDTPYRAPSAKVLAISQCISSIYNMDNSGGMPALQSPSSSSSFSGTVNLASQKCNKVVVFSQYNDMLDLLYRCMIALGIPSAVYTGTMSLAKRAQLVTAFHEPPTLAHLDLPLLQRPPRVILMNIKSSSEGLNLQAANHAIITEPWWNASIELQAVSRIHRIGNMRQCQIIQFHNMKTIEEKMIALQARKLMMIQATVDKQKVHAQGLSHEDIQFLFKR